MKYKSDLDQLFSKTNFSYNNALVNQILGPFVFMVAEFDEPIKVRGVNIFDCMINRNDLNHLLWNQKVNLKRMLYDKHKSYIEADVYIKNKSLKSIITGAVK